MIIFLIIGQAIAQISQNYKIPSYYGSREQDFLLRGSVLSGNLSSFYWYPSICKYGDFYYFSDFANHVIWKIDEQKKTKTLVAGILGQSGYRNGDLSNTLFNNPTGIIYFRQSLLDQAQERSKITIVLINNSTECLQSTSANYTICQDNTKPLITNVSTILNQTTYNTYDYVDPQLILDIYLLSQDEIAQLTNKYLDPIIYVVDQGNDCIRKLVLQTKISTTMAGICGNQGFKDGESGINQFSTPSNFGIDILGNLFVYDQGNQYIRMISPDGQVITLIGGACRQDVRYPSIFYQTLEVRRVICYKNWNKMNGQPSSHLLTPDDNMTICTNHYTQC